MTMKATQKVTIGKLDSPTSIMSLNGIYQDENGVTHYLLKDGKTMRSDDMSKDDLEYAKANLYILKIHANERKKVFDKSKDNDRKVVEFFKNDPRVKLAYDAAEDKEGNDYIKTNVSRRSMGKKKAQIIDHELESIYNMYKSKTSAQVNNIIGSLSKSAIYNLAFYLGVETPHYKDQFTVYNEVLNLAQEKGPEFLRWYNDPEKEYRIVAHKAIEYQVIEKKSDTWYFGSTALGAEIDDVVAYFKKNKEQYEKTIKTQVSAQDSNWLEMEANQVTDIEKKGEEGDDDPEKALKEALGKNKSGAKSGGRRSKAKEATA